MILLLDKSLTENEKKFSQLQTDYQLVENENKTLRTRLTVFERKSIELSTLLTNYYEDLLDGKL